MRIILIISIAIWLACANGVASRPSIKKGLAITPTLNYCEDWDRWEDAVWWYDWGHWPVYERRNNCTDDPLWLPPTIEYVPMQWKWWSSTNVTNRFPSTGSYILGFNEPNHRSQADMSAAEAALVWPLMEEEARRTGKQLVSPAAAPCGSGELNCHADVHEWFADFFDLCQGCQVDYLATHFYTCNADSMMNYLESLWLAFGKRIWLTEFSCPGGDSTTRQLNYMAELLPRLEAADYVFRYSWYVNRKMNEGGVTNPTVNTMETLRSGLTRLGEFYNAFQPDN